MKKYLRNPFFWLIALLLLCGATASLTGVNFTNGSVLETVQSGWVIAESETSASTQTDALAVTERTKKIVDALIAANANEEAQISILRIPSNWNAVRVRALGITDAATVTHEIYLGTLGGRNDCELTYAGSFAWVIGTQTSIYDQITFTSGGLYEPQPGDTVIGNSSGVTAEIVSIVDSASTWSAGTAAGTVLYKSVSGAFTNSETITVVRNSDRLSKNAYTHAASDAIDFELADTLVVTAAAWGSEWKVTSPADNTNAEGEVDVKGADILVIVTSATSVDSKLLIRGF